MMWKVLAKWKQRQARPVWARPWSPCCRADGECPAFCSGDADTPSSPCRPVSTFNCDYFVILMIVIVVIAMSSGVQRIVSNFSFHFHFFSKLSADISWSPLKYQIFNSDMIRKKVQINFVILEKPKYKIFSTEVNRKKVQIILVILCFSLVGAFILTLVNVSHDLQVYSGIWKKSFLQHQHQEIRTFYKGFMGRKLLLSEQLLLRRQKVSKQRLETFTIDQIVK